MGNSCILKLKVPSMDIEIELWKFCEYSTHIDSGRIVMFARRGEGRGGGGIRAEI